MDVFLPDSDVEYVWAYGRGDRHVSEAFPCHDHARDQVGDGSAGGEECETHHLEIKEEKTGWA